MVLRSQFPRGVSGAWRLAGKLQKKLNELLIIPEWVVELQGLLARMTNSYRPELF
jgi:hypothetical protein